MRGDDMESTAATGAPDNHAPAATETAPPKYGTPEWLRARWNYVGASEVPALMGASSFGGPFDLYQSKRGLIEPPDSQAIKRGHWYEPAIAAEYADRFPDVQLHSVGTVMHPEFGYLGATLDRLVTRSQGPDYVLEIKKVNPFLVGEYGPDGSDQLPDDKIIQVQTQMLVADKPYAHVAVDFGHELRVYPIQRDPDFQALILQAVTEFWFVHHLANVPPVIDGPNAQEHLKRKYATHNGLLIPADELTTKLIYDFGKAKAEKKDATEREDVCKTELMRVIGHNLGIDSPAGKVTWTETAGKPTFDLEGFVHALGVPKSVVDQFSGRGDAFRTMRYAEPKRPGAKRR